MSSLKNQIICGEFLEITKEWLDKSIDLVVTDIPYGISQEHGGLREIDYGEWDKEIPTSLVIKWVGEMLRLSKNGVAIFCGDNQFSHIFNFCSDMELITRKFVWQKTNPNVMNGQHFWLSSGELCVVAKFPNAIFNGNCEKAYKISSAPIDRYHPNQKPIDIMQKLIAMQSNENDLILDPFAGSGTTLRAAKDLKRNYIGIEIDPEYVAIAEGRLKQGILNF